MPLVFHPLLKPRVWGGRFLQRLGKALPQGEAIGESWEVADLPASIPDGQSVIAEGPLAGLGLREAIQRDPRGILGDARPAADGGFPLLIKYLDARENLSVQVHPTEEYVRRHPEAHLKSEAWYVLHAEPNAVIYRGLRPREGRPLTREQLRAAIASGRIVEHLEAVRATAGQCHYLPSGTVHALGAGIVVAEVQTPSDTTFRIYDWGRDGPGAPGAPGARDMHIEQALECIIPDRPLGGSPPPTGEEPPLEAAGLRTWRLLQCPHFAIERVEAVTGREIEIITNGLPEVWMVLSGSGRIEAPGWPIFDMRPGRTILMPAGLPAMAARVEPGACLLRVTVPSPLAGAIA